MLKRYTLSRKRQGFENKGFTLLENSIAILLLGIIITVTLLSLVTARMYTVATKHNYQAINLAREEIEKILAGQTPSTGAVTIDADTALLGTISVSYPTTNTAQITVSWTEKMWASIAKSETIVVYVS